MADINILIRRIRARIHDSVDHDVRDDGRPLYLDNHYIDSIDSGLGRLNLDLDSSYAIATLPTKYEYLLELRGTINMCYVRGAEGASSDVEDFPSVPDYMVSVPQLSVQKQQMSVDGPKYWLRLVDKLENEYNNAIARLEARGDEGAEIQQMAMTRPSLRTGRRTQYVYDKAITAPDVAVAVANGKVQITWNPIYDIYFRLYEIQRSGSADLSTTSVVYQSSDNHDVSFTDTPGVGTWYYRLATVNSNNLYGYSQVASVVVQ
jgi:hypothetical protein